MLNFPLYRDQCAFYNFVNAIRADGGGDSAEDIMGGLQAAFSKLSWGDEEVVKVRTQDYYNVDTRPTYVYTVHTYVRIYVCMTV